MRWSLIGGVFFLSFLFLFQEKKNEKIVPQEKEISIKKKMSSPSQFAEVKEKVNRQIKREVQGPEEVREVLLSFQEKKNNIFLDRDSFYEQMERNFALYFEHFQKNLLSHKALSKIEGGFNFRENPPPVVVERMFFFDHIDGLLKRQLGGAEKESLLGLLEDVVKKEVPENRSRITKQLIYGEKIDAMKVLKYHNRERAETILQQTQQRPWFGAVNYAFRTVESKEKL